MSAIHVGIYGRFKFYGLDNRKSVKYAVSLPFYIIKIAFLLYRDAKKLRKSLFIFAISYKKILGSCYRVCNGKS